MEKKRTGIWIFVIVALAALALLCGCLVLAGVATIPWWGDWDRPAWLDRSWRLDGSLSYRTERMDERFDVGAQPVLDIEHFAGTVTIEAGSDDAILVTATKRARSAETLSRIRVDMKATDDRLTIVTRAEPAVSNASVNLDITAPPGTRVSLSTGAGTVTVRGLTGGASIRSGAGTIRLENVTGPLDLETGAGTIEVRGGSGQVRIGSGAGSIDFEGRPSGDCSFDAGAGTITLRLPADLDMQVDLRSGLGSIRVDFDVDGTVTRREVKGTIGTGAGGTLRVHASIGSVTLDRR